MQVPGYLTVGDAVLFPAEGVAVGVEQDAQRHATLLGVDQSLDQWAMGQVEHLHIYLVAGLGAVDAAEQRIANCPFGEYPQAWSRYRGGGGRLRPVVGKQ